MITGLPKVLAEPPQVPRQVPGHLQAIADETGAIDRCNGGDDHDCSLIPPPLQRGGDGADSLPAGIDRREPIEALNAAVDHQLREREWLSCQLLGNLLKVVFVDVGVTESMDELDGFQPRHLGDQVGE